jgi:hypothetical protein
MQTLLKTRRNMPRRLCARTLLLAGVTVLGAPLAPADEGGVPFWLSGQFSSLAAVPPAPGASLVLMPYYYDGSAGVSRTFDRGDSLVASLRAQTPLVFLQAGYAPQEKILDGQPFVSLAWGAGRSSAQADIVAASGPERSTSQSLEGGTDLYPYASLSWNKGVNNEMVYLTGDIPTGAYDSNRIANIGIGHGAIDYGAGYTYLNDKNGHEVSVVLGFTFNFQNPDTHYTNGADFHVDWAVDQFLSEHVLVGLVGYVYQQLTADSYPTAGALGVLRTQALGSFESGVASVGGEAGYLFTMGGKQAYLNLRGYSEFWAQNRVRGYAIFGTIVIPLGG